MSEEKDDFLREIDELLQGDLDVEEEAPLPKKTEPASVENVSNGVADLDLNSLDGGLNQTPSEQLDSNHVSGPPLQKTSPPPKTGVEALRAAVASHESIETIQELFEGGRIPKDVRAEFWKECLNVSRRPDALGSWTGPLDCENQSIIHSQCVEQSGKLSDLDESGRQEAADNMEQVITFYCKSRNLRYSPECGWPELLLPFVSLDMSRADLFNCFYAIMAKYIPKDCKADGRPFHLFRLLVLYHDPELCSYLDTKKLAPEIYLQPWLRSLFVQTCDMEVLMVLWDHYFTEKDPFFIFFLALVMIANSKENVMENNDATREEIAGTLTSIPCQLSSVDINDFFSLAHYYASKTPQSFRKDYHSLLFGSGRNVASLATNVSSSLCLPISLQEVLDMNQTTQMDPTQNETGVHYFIVDCRPVEHYSCGHLPNSFHLDANLLLHSPSDFAVAADRLCARVKRAGVEGGEHLCFLGSGREQEDQYVNMVVAKFLQKSIPYVSLARGGFLELSALLSGNMSRVLEDYDGSRCKVLYSDDALPHISSSRSDASDSDSEGYSRYRQRLQAKGAKLYTNLASGFRGKSQNFKSRISGFWNSQKKQEEKHVSQLDRPSKRYRNVHADVFVIADEDEENEARGVSSSEDEGQEMVNISLYSTSPEIMHSFPATEIKDKAQFHSHILLTPDSLLVLRELSDRAGWARVKHRHKLETVLKITAKKKNPDIITFKFGTGAGEMAVVTEQLRFRIPNTHKATEAIKNQILKYQGQLQGRR